MRKFLDQGICRRRINIGQPLPHCPIRPRAQRHVDQPGLWRGDIRRNGGTAVRFKMRSARKIKTIKPRKRLFHLCEVINLLFQRRGVLLFQFLIHTRKARVGAQKRCQAIQYVHITQIIIIDVERCLPTDLQGTVNAHLKPLYRLQVCLECGGIKGDRYRLCMGGIRQLPLPCGLRDLPTDKAIQRVACQDDFGATRIIDACVQDTRIMIMKEPKPSQCIALLDLGQQGMRVFFASVTIHAQQCVRFGISHKRRIESLPVTADAIKHIDVRL